MAFLYWHDLNEETKKVINKCKKNKVHEENGIVVDKLKNEIWVACKKELLEDMIWVRIIKKTFGWHGYGYPKIKTTDSAMDY